MGNCKKGEEILSGFLAGGTMLRREFAHGPPESAGDTESECTSSDINTDAELNTIYYPPAASPVRTNS